MKAFGQAPVAASTPVRGDIQSKAEPTARATTVEGGAVRHTVSTDQSDPVIDQCSLEFSHTVRIECTKMWRLPTKTVLNRCFSILLSGCETGQRFRCYVVATPSAAEHKHMHSTVREFNCDHVVLARFSVLSSIFDFFSDAEKTKMLCHDRCSVSH